MFQKAATGNRRGFFIWGFMSSLHSPVFRHSGRRDWIGWALVIQKQLEMLEIDVRRTAEGNIT